MEIKKRCLECDIEKEFLGLLSISQETNTQIKGVKQGVEKLLESQLDVVALLEELKPLRSLPAIAENLNKVVDRLIEPATRTRHDWPALLLVFLISTLLISVIFKDQNFTGAVKWLGSEATLENSPQKKTN